MHARALALVLGYAARGGGVFAITHWNETSDCLSSQPTSLIVFQRGSMCKLVQRKQWIYHSALGRKCIWLVLSLKVINAQTVRGNNSQPLKEWAQRHICTLSLMQPRLREWVFPNYMILSCNFAVVLVNDTSFRRKKKHTQHLHSHQCRHRHDQGPHLTRSATSGGHMFSPRRQ